MSNEKRPGTIHRFVAAMASNWISLIGANVATVSVGAIGFLVALMTFAGLHHAYIGIVAFVLLPIGFVFGLLLIPLGLWHARRRKQDAIATQAPLRFPVLDFNVERTRRTAMLVFLLTLVNIGIVGAVSYEGVKYTESNAFCGMVCHTPMDPHYTAFLDSPHRSLGCAECHIGEGAQGFAAAKLSGVRQLFEAITDTYPRPIPTERERMPVLNETCTHCHDQGASEQRVFSLTTKYLEDEANTPVYTAMLLNLGSIEADTGIHGWHNQPGRSIEYIPGDAPEDPVKAVRVAEPDGGETEYQLTNSGPEDVWRTMTCVDCHNRIGHRFIPPGEAVDAEISKGAIDRSLPYVRSTAVAALTALPDGDEDVRLDEVLEAFYRDSYPDVAADQATAIKQASAALQAIAARNYHDAMKVSWNTYLDQSGHVESLGCFRCHDDAHTAPTGQTIRQDCTICHQVLAWDEESSEVLETLGILPP